MALVVGAGSGLGAVVFRYLLYAVTWLVTGHEEFGQQGRIASPHLPFIGIWFLLVIPVLGGLIYGPLIEHFAPEARGHGVPEVMIAVAEDGSRIRPQVTIVKALASAICIGTGGSVGREGPIVQIGSALASSLGQAIRMPENRLRVIVACGAAGGIAATFNAPITGVFFGFELILRVFSIDALFSIILSAAIADVVSQAFFGSQPFFYQVPHDLSLHADANYLLVALLGIIAGLIGVGFNRVLYQVEDVCDALWKGRPEWLRPAVGGLVLGGVLLALPEMYGVGYPVMDKVLAGHEVLWLLVVLMFAKMFTSSLTIGIGGSGGVFAPALFTGAMAGTAFGEIARHLFGPAVGTPAIYGVVAMGAVFGAAAQAPLTAIASVLEMTGNFGLTLPVMLGVGIASGISKYLTYGTIYTTKLLRRGIDIDQPRPQTALRLLHVTDVMQPLARHAGGLALSLPDKEGQLDVALDTAGAGSSILFEAMPEGRQPEVLFPEDTLEDVLGQLALEGPDGLPVVSTDRAHLVGWLTNDDVLHALAAHVRAVAIEARRNTQTTGGKGDVRGSMSVSPPALLMGYTIVEIPVASLRAAGEQRLSTMEWPTDWIVVAVANGRRTIAADDDVVLRPGDRVVLLVPSVRQDGGLGGERVAREDTDQIEGPTLE